MKTIFRLLNFSRPLRHYLPEYFIFSLLSSIFGALNFTMLIPVFNMLFSREETIKTKAMPDFRFSIDYAIDTLQYYISFISSQHSQMWALGLICSIILLFSILNNVCKYVAIRTSIRMRTNIALRLRNALYHKILTQSVAYHTKNQIGESMSVMTVEVQEIEHSAVESFQSWVRNPIMIIVYMSILFYMSAHLTLFTILFFPIAGFLVSRMLSKLRRIGQVHQNQLSNLISLTEDTFVGAKIIQSYSATEFFFSQFKKANRRLTLSIKKMFTKRELASPMSETMGVSIVIVLVLYGGYLIINNVDNTFTPAMFMGYLAIYSQIISPLKALANTSSLIQRGIVASKKVFEVLDMPSSILDKENALEKKMFDSEIHIKNVSFTYGEGKQVLNNINLKIKKGESVAFVGESGSGKTSICNLLNRFYEPTEGEITIDNTDIKEVKLDDLRGLISYVSQENILFHDTILHNIALGRNKSKKDEVELAAKIAHADAFINENKEKYHTTVGEKGMKLSGGQRQRMTIARAIYKNAPIFLLDEATSALDSKSEKYVQDAIGKLMKEKTSIIIAHRLSTIKHADRIIVMKDGHIVEQGSHAHLIKKKQGHYKHLVAAQSLR